MRRFKLGVGQGGYCWRWRLIRNCLEKACNDYVGRRADLGFFRSVYGAEIDIVERLGVQQRLFEVKVGGKKVVRKKGAEVITPADAQKYLY